MRIHRNARTCPNSRRLLVRRIEEEGWALIPAAEATGISERTSSLLRPRRRLTPRLQIQNNDRHSRPCAGNL